MKAQEEKYIYTDDVDYANTPNDSVWGTEDTATALALERLERKGKWLNLCAGDGRFNTVLLGKVNEVVAVDIDETALQKLVRITPVGLQSKLQIVVVNIAEQFPFLDTTFDGIFCVGTLHLFPKDILQKIFREMDRVLKSNGRMIVDFATDIKRIHADGSLWVIKNEPNYTLDEARNFLKDLFTGYAIVTKTDTVAPEVVTLKDRAYTFTSNFLLIEAKKLKH